ncbi:MAG: CARDB domain-containing protein, partial [Bacteroidota bacterium]
MDNILAFPITLSSTTSSIELAPVNYSLSANTIAAGSNITANFAASNTGTTAAGAFNVGFYLSNSTTLDTTKAINLGVYTIASLNASTTTSSLNKTLTIPTVICSGTYYLFIFVDNGRVITETNENNNTSYQTINLTSSWTPTTPANPTSNSPQCGNVTITRNGAPVTGDTWYWQTSPTGTSQSLGSGTTYTAATSGTYYIRAYNTFGACWSSGSGSGSVTIITTPSAASIITGATTVCQGQNSVTYTIPTIDSATSYIWTLPTGAIGTSTTNSITVSYGNTAISGNITVKGHNSCGNGVSSSLAITVNQLPPTAGTISGTTTVCSGQSSLIYTVPVIANATSYVWTLPTGATGTSSTNSITVNYGNNAISGNISVYGTDSCGNGVPSSLAITLSSLPATAGTISGTTTVCQGQSSVTYTVPSIINATSYIWTLPTGVIGTSSTNSITVSYGNTAVSGNITVYGINSCGNGISSSLAISVSPLPVTAGTISGVTTVCQGQISLIDTVPGITNATSYIWTLPTGATGTNTTNNIIVNYSNTAISGNITVKGHNTCGDGTSSLKAITVNPLPATAGTISGTTSVYVGQSSLTYTVPAITNATSYVWTLPSGATGTSSTNSITVSYSNNAV